MSAKDIVDAEEKEIMNITVKYIIGAVVGAIIGGVIGYFGRCSGSV